jgi:uncharacterized protein (TIGR02145 family)
MIQKTSKSEKKFPSFCILIFSIFILTFAFSLSPSASAQAPQKMSYQAVIRNASNALVTSHAVGMKISILQGSSSGSAVYVETHTPTTNANGLASIEIGAGTVASGTFSAIDWSTGTYFIKTETDPAGGTSYTITGTSQLLSVPYALYAKNVAGTSGTNTGDNAVNTTYSVLVTNATHSGDATGSGALTLATVNSNVGTYNNVTINAKGLATAGSNVSYLTTEADATVKAINGIVKSNGTTISAATAGTDYLTPSGSAASLTNFPTLNQSTTGSAASFTGSMIGDVTGTQGATVVSAVGGVTAANVASGANLANAATNANTASTIVKRDASGNFTAGTISAALNGNAATATTAATVTTAAQPAITSVGTLTGLTVSGTTTIATPVNATDAANKAYVDELKQQIKILEDNLITAGSYKLADVEGNLYNVVKINTQIWMSENLKTTKYNDGTSIPNITATGEWAAATTGAYSNYSNDPNNSTTYGKLYNWFTVDNNEATKIVSNGGKNVCPTGWHVPSDTEWLTLTTSLGGESAAGGKLKESGSSHWTYHADGGATNSSFFSALPGGYHSTGDAYSDLENFGFWWSSSTAASAGEAYYRKLGYSFSHAFANSINKLFGFSVRCLKN